jgi:ABC-type oligopeptide transport system substrate-binding subunit
MKIKKLVICLALVLALSFSFAACGGGGSDSNSDKDSSAASGVETDKFLQDTVDDAQSEIPSLEDQFGGLMKIAIEARGNTLVYSYKYTTTIDDVDAAAQTLKDGLEAEAATFEGILDVLKDNGVPSPSVLIEYINKDGTGIYSKEFK